MNRVTLLAVVVVVLFTSMFAVHVSLLVTTVRMRTPFSHSLIVDPIQVQYLRNREVASGWSSNSASEDDLPEPGPATHAPVDIRATRARRWYDYVQHTVEDPLSYDGLVPESEAVQLRKLRVPTGRNVVSASEGAVEDSTVFYMHNSARIIDWINKQRGEQFVTSVFVRVLGDRAGELEPNAVVLDIGANAGFYGLLASSLGYNTVFFDPQPQCVSRILLALRANNFGERSRIVAHAVTDELHTSILATNDSECEGRFPINEVENNGKLAAERLNTFELPSVSVREVLSPGVPWEIMVVKIDTEGHELHILKDLMPFFRTNQIQHAVVELSPKFWRLLGVRPVDVADTLVEIAACGYKGETMDASFPTGQAMHAWVVSGRLAAQRDLHLMLA